MTRFDPYLNFDGKTEEAFNFYKSVFGGESATVIRFKDMPIEDVSLPKGEADKIMHIGLPIGRAQVLMGTELLESLGQKLVMGNNLHISIQPDSKEEAGRLFAALAQGGKIGIPMAGQPWGDDYGDLQDGFGVHWMANYHQEE